MANSDNQHSPEFSNNAKSNRLFEEPATSSDNFREKLERDIAFLRDRIQRLQEQQKDNPISLRTYKNMLNDRLAILARL